MDNIPLDGDATSPVAADDEYSKAMDKLNATLKRASTRSLGRNGGLDGGPPDYIFGSGNSVSSSVKEHSIVFSNHDDYDPSDLLPAVEEARTTAASLSPHSDSLFQRSYRMDDDYDDEQRRNLFSNQKRSQCNKNRWMIAFFVLFAVVIGVTIGLVVGFTAGEGYQKLVAGAGGQPVVDDVPQATPYAPSPVWPGLSSRPPQPVASPTSPTPFPTRQQRIQSVIDWLVQNEVSSQQAFDDSSSHQFQAARWIADEDIAYLPLPQGVGQKNSFEFIERYVLAVLYLSLGGRSVGNSWTFTYKFFSTESVCKWNELAKSTDNRKYQLGVTCDGNGSVVSIHIPSNSLRGTVVSELGKLTNLNYLALNHNLLSGRLPTEMGELTKLTYLALHYNQFSGTLPDWISNFGGLRVLGLGNNKFEGSIPVLWSGLTELATLGFDDNLITGDLAVVNVLTNLERMYFEDNLLESDLSSTPWEQFLKLRELDLSDNSIMGNLPSELTSLPLLRILNVANNNIAGQLPAQYPTDSPLKYFAVYGNAFDGPVPSTLGNLGNLTHLDLADNGLTGFLPLQLSNLQKLEYLFLANNRGFHESVIPTFIGALTSLKDLSLKGTNRVASINPAVFLNLPQLTMLDLDDNDLTGEIPSELGQISSLSYLLLNGNDGIYGTVPSEVQLLPQLDIFLVDRTSVTGDLNQLCNKSKTTEIAGADCHGGEVQCSCCNICCQDGVNATTCRDKVYFGQIDPIWENSYERKEYQFDGLEYSKPILSSGVSTHPDGLPTENTFHWVNNSLGNLVGDGTP
jgi:Leucine-rich repeat (LRR) protein